jgi:hypothetical protein
VNRNLIEVWDGIRSAQAIAINDGQPFSAKYVETVIKLNEQFKEDFESVDSDNYHAKVSFFLNRRDVN